MAFEYASRASKGARSYQEDSAHPCRAEAAGSAAAAPDGSADALDGGAGRRHGRACRRRAGQPHRVQSLHALPTRRLDGERAGAARRGAQARQRRHRAQCVEENPALDGMGCTLVGAVFGPAGVEWVSVGDSPLFLLRRGEIVLLNEDHSLAPEIDKLAAAGTHELGGRQGRSAPALPALGADRRRHRSHRPLAPAAGAGARRRRDPRQRRHPHAERSRHPARSCRRMRPTAPRRSPMRCSRPWRPPATSTRTTPRWW